MAVLVDTGFYNVNSSNTISSLNEMLDLNMRGVGGGSRWSVWQSDSGDAENFIQKQHGQFGGWGIRTRGIETTGSPTNRINLSPSYMGPVGTIGFYLGHETGSSLNSFIAFVNATGNASSAGSQVTSYDIAKITNTGRVGFMGNEITTITPIPVTSWNNRVWNYVLFAWNHTAGDYTLKVNDETIFSYTGIGEYTGAMYLAHQEDGGYGYEVVYSHIRITDQFETWSPRFTKPMNNPSVSELEGDGEIIGAELTEHAALHTAPAWDTGNGVIHTGQGNQYLQRVYPDKGASGIVTEVLYDALTEGNNIQLYEGETQANAQLTGSVYPLPSNRQAVYLEATTSEMLQTGNLSDATGEYHLVGFEVI